MKIYNNISIRPLYKFVIWLFFGFLIFVYGVSHPLAAAAGINGTIYSSDISLSAQAQWYDTSHNSIDTSAINSTSISSYYRSPGKLTSYLSFNLYTNLDTSTLYSMTVFVNNSSGSNVQNWNNNISTGTYTGGANSNNNNGTCRVEVYSLVDSYNIKYALNMSGPEAQPTEATTGAYYITFKPTCSGNYINIPISFSGSSSYMYFYGYHLEILGLVNGLSSSDVQDVINSSGLATASSVADVKSSVNEVKQEINGMQNQQIETNKKLDEQNETSKGIFGKIKELFAWLTNDDAADVSGAGDVAGWLPPGPLDSLINLPLTMLQNINTSLNKTCSPLTINLPFVNKSVEIPCLNTIFNQITGLNSFWTWVGMIASVMILFRYLVNLYEYYDKLTTLQANFISDWGGV